MSSIFLFNLQNYRRFASKYAKPIPKMRQGARRGDLNNYVMKKYEGVSNEKKVDVISVIKHIYIK